MKKERMKCGCSFRASARSISSRMRPTSALVITFLDECPDMDGLTQRVADRRVDDIFDLAGAVHALILLLHEQTALRCADVASDASPTSGHESCDTET